MYLTLNFMNVARNFNSVHYPSADIIRKNLSKDGSSSSNDKLYMEKCDYDIIKMKILVKLTYITDSSNTISTTTTTVEPTSTPTNSEPSVTVKPGYAPITVKSMNLIVLTSRKGYFYSMAHPHYCLRVVKMLILELGKCVDQTKMVYDNDGFLTLIESNGKCVGFLKMIMICITMKLK
ncbi:hypothetical protein PIROE2DRAFT_6699 [Piromyces sp. E2]|nr:hypothetical protein PIROE2DRAFT_6699 [Piromyces sp. E2]|eukprot:OUM66170.1 hypothetical protein PIROE2DRAFT_6699 [Piromyces sp. E2]